MLTFNNNMPKSFGFESENNYFLLIVFPFVDGVSL